MADLSKGFKEIWMKSMEAIGDTASKIASNTKYKVNEMNLVNRRREILSDFGACAYELWQKGEHFPEKLESLLSELSRLDTELNEIRMEKLASMQPPKADDAAANDDAAKQSEATPTVQEMADDLADKAAGAASAVGTVFDNALEAIRRAVRGEKDAQQEEASAPDTTDAKEEPREAEPVEAEPAKAEESVPVIQVQEDGQEKADEDQPQA